MKLSKRGFIIALSVTTFAFVLLLFLSSPFFHVQELVVLGNSRVSQGEILERANVSSGSNMLLFNARVARESVLGNPFIGYVGFRREFPGRLIITVQERRLSGYVEHTPGNFLVLDDVGRVLEIRTGIAEPLPIIEGLRFERVQLGEILEVHNQTDFSNIVYYTQLLIIHGLIDQITHVNVADPSNIRILVNYMEFHVGGVSDADEKVRTIAAILEQTPDVGRMRGYMDMRTLRPEYFFVLLQ